MSNVLIGIIGVILFIGLALAGALILGSDFLSASAASKAAATTAQLQQAAQAITMRNVKTGAVMTANEFNTVGQSLLVPRFLKSMPVNPTGGPAIFAQDQQARTVGSDTGPVYVLGMIMPRETRSRTICEAIADSTGKSMEDGAVQMVKGNVGCTYASTDALYYAAYVNVS